MDVKNLLAAAAALGIAACTVPTDAPPDEESPQESERTNVGGKGDYFGDDDRKDPFHGDVTDRQRRWARSTALMVDESDIVEDEGGNLSLDTTPFNEERDLCEDANFAQQPTVGSCSSFLVKPDVLVTAGHCVDWGFSCEDNRFVFDYGYYDEGQNPTQITEDQVYRCEEIMAEKYEGNGLDELDYAVIKLEEPVDDREPLEMRQEGHVQPGTHLTLIGNPDGLPTKVDSGGVAFHTTDTRFVATNDSFSGHSGGLVMNNATGVVEAVHVASGGQRYVRDEEESCYRARNCQQANTDGECQGSIGVYTEHWRQFVEESQGGGDAGLGDAGLSDAGTNDAGSNGSGSDTSVLGDVRSQPDTGSTTTSDAGSGGGDL